MESSSDFQGLLATLLEAVERGEKIDRERLLREHPQYAESLCQFVDNDQFLRAGVQSSKPEEGASGSHSIDPMATIDPLLTLDSQDESRASSESRWSYGQLTAASFPVEFGDYSLLCEIDRGGMGIVYKAQHNTLRRIVALKVLRSGELSNPEELARFRAEAEATAGIEHPNIVSIFEVGEVRGLVFFTMAFVDGENLSTIVRRERMLAKEAARIVSRVADAVGAAHQRGIIHRDLKPSNLLLDAMGEPHLIDFGLAKTGANASLTCAGQILGTPAYMAPEQARGTDVTPACDVYALGGVLYELVSGEAPFIGPTPVDILLQVLNREAPSARTVNKQVPRALDRIINRAMQKKPEERYESAIALQQDLQRFILGEPIERSHSSLWERAEVWWRREPVLVSHLVGIFFVLCVVIVSILIRGTSLYASRWILGLLTLWGVCSFPIQKLSVYKRFRELVYFAWLSIDVVIYTTLIFMATPPRGLLLIGYPMMIAASGLFYRSRFVVFVTGISILGFIGLWASVDDPFKERLEFGVIYASGLIVLAICLLAMIRRIRGLVDYFAGGENIRGEE
ncbi:Serine/threonine-protein kinase PrkC [Roseimaritima multifibrata]|uniref:non-specific serine/threonine protein kinase n=1 Tax=Roseimaritima multifibrata TaxID=1930274 RepID=A0A517MKH8_9BACT|nr:serine/threonine-protein kinase [Roseimaritima multifibrata]QDS95374.1 Serine/threonine-protein kinase PrkC [Roseimaritima multifibrata]